MLQSLASKLLNNGSPQRSRSNSPDRGISPGEAAGSTPENLRPKETGLKSGFEGYTPDDLIRRCMQLENELIVKESIISATTSKLTRMEDEAMSMINSLSKQQQSTTIDLEDITMTSTTSSQADDVVRRVHTLQPISHVISDEGRVQKKMGTRGSVATASVLDALPEVPKTREQSLAERFLAVFKNPEEYISYLSSTEFAEDLTHVCRAVSDVFEDEPRCVFLQSPVYVFGDIHGNLEDLHFFADNIWKLGMDLTAGKFLFLGDYVDRGLSSLECVAYLFGLKLLYPTKLQLLRGNHETRDVSKVILLYNNN